MATASPKLAPALMPNIDGLAMGLWVIPCMSAPETAKLTPQMTAARSLGQRSVRMMSSAVFELSKWINESTIVISCMSFAPVYRDKTASNTAAVTSPVLQTSVLICKKIPPSLPDMPKISKHISCRSGHKADSPSRVNRLYTHISI